MRRLVVLSCILVLASSIDWTLDNEWKEFKMRFGKVYHGRGDETFRRELWEDNREYVILNNAIAPMAESIYTMRVNQFSDMVRSVGYDDNSIYQIKPATTSLLCEFPGLTREWMGITSPGF